MPNFVVAIEMITCLAAGVEFPIRSPWRERLDKLLRYELPDDVDTAGVRYSGELLRVDVIMPAETTNAPQLVSEIRAGVRRAVEGVLDYFRHDLLPGMQVVYVPEHAGEDPHHPACEPGFVVKLNDWGIYCRFWDRHAPHGFVAENVSKLVPRSRLVVMDVAPQEAVQTALRRLQALE